LRNPSPCVGGDGFRCAQSVKSYFVCAVKSLCRRRAARANAGLTRPCGQARLRPCRKRKRRGSPPPPFEVYRTQWERRKLHRLQRQRGRGKPGDMNYRPAVIGPPRPHKTRAADFLDELLWLGAYVGNDCFHQAYVTVHESSVIKNRKWAKDFRIWSPPGHTLDAFHGCVSHVARMTFIGWSERSALAWAVATFDLPGASFDAAVARMRRPLRSAEKAGLFPV
jgi:hypothetical protein